ncbi:MAG: hypothetical protein ACI8Z1_000749 [Candidatus Azotimanducaceae bacterium]|jgi:hypothetical protein
MNRIKKFIAGLLKHEANRNTNLSCTAVDDYYADLVCVEVVMPTISQTFLPGHHIEAPMATLPHPAHTQDCDSSLRSIRNSY